MIQRITGSYCERGGLQDGIQRRDFKGRSEVRGRNKALSKRRFVVEGCLGR